MAGPSYATFGNTVFSRGFDFTIAPGVQPSTCMIYTVPHVSSLPSVGSLMINLEGGPTYTFRDCLLEDPKLSASIGGHYWQLPIKDRRWKWQFGAIYGHYNKPEANGSYTRERTPQQLASLLFAALDEIGADWSRLPNTTRPEKQWDGANAAAELDALCAQLGCVVVLNWLTDKAEIWPVGDGSVLPSGSSAGQAYTPVQPAMPSRVRVEAAPTLFQATWACEAVGMDTDGRWKPLTQLSYAPVNGFSGSAALAGFAGYWEGQTYTSGGKVLKVQDLAAATVYRCYRIKSINSWVNGIVPPLSLGTELQPATLKDFRFFDDLAEDEIGLDGGLRPLKSVVLARWARLDKPTPAEPIRYPDSFSFDAEQNILTFGEPLFLWGNANWYSQPAEVKFETSFFCGAAGIFHRRFVEGATGSAVTTPTLVIQRPEVQARVIYRFLNDGNQSGTETNLTDTDVRLNYWGNAQLEQYGMQDGGTVTYPGLVALSPDGLTQQVTWSGRGGSGTTTTASQAQRHNRYIEPLDEYRDRLTIKRQEQLLSQLAFGQLAKALGGGA